MKQIPVVLLAVASIGFAGLADSAPKKRTRNANRIGPYGMGMIGQSNWTSDQEAAEQFVTDFLINTENPVRNITTSTEEKDVGYNATFGYRFTRYFAAEVGLAQFGEVSSKADSEMDFGDGFEPTTLRMTFSAGGPMISGLGILPLNDKFEFFGRVGYLFSSSERELTSRVSGERGSLGGIKGDSTDLVLGVGASYHFSQVYSMRVEYQQIDEIGEEDNSGVEDLSVIGIGVVVRF